MNSPTPLLHFTEHGLLKPGDYPLNLEQLKKSILVEGYKHKEDWDTQWRSRLVENLEMLVNTLWEVGVTEIFLDGSFVEEKAKPSDLDGYFEVSAVDWPHGKVIRQLNAAAKGTNTEGIWTWNTDARVPIVGSPTKSQIPMREKFNVELWPHYPSKVSGILDEFGNKQPFPAAFRKTKEHMNKGIVKLIR